MMSKTWSVTPKELIEAFEFLPDWEERYRYLIDLSRKIPEMAQEDRTDANRIFGCQSMIWVSVTGDGEFVHLSAASDSAIVQGLAAIVVGVLDGQLIEDAIAIDLAALFLAIGLDSHLSPTRRNGLHGMVEQVQSRLAGLLGKQSP